MLEYNFLSTALSSHFVKDFSNLKIDNLINLRFNL